MKNWLLALFAHMLPFLKSEEEKAVVTFEQKITPDVVTLTKDSITAVASRGLSDVAAREATIAQMKADAHTLGVDLKDWAKNELNAVVELVYIAVKPTAAAPAVAPAATPLAD